MFAALAGPLNRAMGVFAELQSTIRNKPGGQVSILGKRFYVHLYLFTTPA